MRTKTVCAFASGLFLFTFVAAAHDDPIGEPGQFCRDIHAEMHELRATENCLSPLGFCAAGTIDGNFGLEGTTFFSVDGANAAMPESPGLTGFTGTFTITTARGTLTLRETGVSYPRRGNPAGGMVASIVEVQSGTGRFAKTTGVLLWHGYNGRGLPSDIAVSGRLCTALPRR